MIILKTERDLAAMRPACAIARAVLEAVAAFVRPDLTTQEVDEYAADCIKQHGARSAFLGYRKYPCHICISVNDEVVHGLAGPRRLRFGDIVSLDVGVYYRGFVGDNALTVAVGGCSVEAQRLMDVTESALTEGIAQARSGNRVTDVSRAIQTCVERNGYSVVREFVGHGVGRAVHEPPEVPNFVDARSSARLRAGMTLAIEPMVNLGGAAIKVLSDGWTAVTQDGSLSAHFEHTVLVTDGAPEILTCSDRAALRWKA
ncbi:MAG TPA: type I methionyl aminopeptidase [Verrucomicrobiota bacterium]|jgi:methionyl aminopeptidase|nr:type I methionyl aminopeptidase [Verrucomicrobiota bacterium]HPY29384.1 type I methionyl aminopeptidase [Verrucomicrobiota bacterium]HQB15968.1 type I methionyl aminopeptidase [Verrucomicrobiota bacterium]